MLREVYHLCLAADPKCREGEAVSFVELLLYVQPNATSASSSFQFSLGVLHPGGSVIAQSGAGFADPCDSHSRAYAALRQRVQSPPEVQELKSATTHLSQEASR